MSPIFVIGVLAVLLVLLLERGRRARRDLDLEVLRQLAKAGSD